MDTDLLNLRGFAFSICLDTSILHAILLKLKTIFVISVQLYSKLATELVADVVVNLNIRYAKQTN